MVSCAILKQFSKYYIRITNKIPMLSNIYEMFNTHHQGNEYLHHHKIPNFLLKSLIILYFYQIRDGKVCFTLWTNLKYLGTNSDGTSPN